MSLPLPKHNISGPRGTGDYFNGHTDAALQAYGQACREQALEEAAMAAENGFKYALDGYQIADNIRSLKP